MRSKPNLNELLIMIVQCALLKVKCYTILGDSTETVLLIFVPNMTYNMFGGTLNPSILLLYTIFRK